jgi:hypothetical protein
MLGLAREQHACPWHPRLRQEWVALPGTHLPLLLTPRVRTLLAHFLHDAVFVACGTPETIM